MAPKPKLTEAGVPPLEHDASGSVGDGEAEIPAAGAPPREMVSTAGGSDAFREWLDNLPVVVSEVAPDGRILYCNAFALQLMGYSREELGELRAADLYVQSGDREALIRELASTGRATAEVAMRRKDGQVVWLEGAARAVRNAAGEVISSLGYYIDVTERRQRAAEAEALQSLRGEVWRMVTPDDIERVLTAMGEALTSAGIDFVEYGINLVDDEGAVPQIRHVVRRLDGDWVRTEELGGQVPVALAAAWRRQEVLYHPDLAAEDLLQLRTKLEARSGKPIRSVIDVPFSHGTVSANSERAAAFGERQVAFLGQVAEVLAEGYHRLDDLQALAESEARYRALVETPDLGLILWLPDGTYLYVSPQVERWTGYRAHEFYADRRLGQELIHPDDQAPLEQTFRVATEGDATRELEYRWRARGETEYRWASQITYPVISEDGRVTAVQAVIQDVTDRRRMRQDQVRLERLRGLGEMAAGVSHNLNNMLTGILAPAEIMMLTAPDEKTRREAGRIHRAGVRASDLVQRLTRSVRGDEAEAPRPVSVDHVVADVVAATRPRWRDEVEARGAAIAVHVDLGEIPPVRATASGLHDVLVNLVFNAVDALPQGGSITIAAGLEGRHAWVEVIDDGVGMDEETRSRALEPFFTTKMTVGTGLGLSTVYGTVSRWGGSVELASTLGSGTRVRVHLPLWVSESESEVRPPSPAATRGGRILVVEDEEVVREMLRGALGGRHIVKAAPTGQEALALFEPGAFDLAFIDLGLPGMAGDQVARELRRSDASLVTVLITGWDLEDADPRREPFDLHLQKPFASLAALESAVAEALALHQRRAEMSH